MTPSTLELARTGDDRAFAELVAPYRRELHVHCYRMLGSVDDADDLLQETLLAAWQGLSGFAGRASLRSWLYAIATRRCLNAIRDGRRRPRSAPQPPFDPPEPTDRDEIGWLQPYPDALLNDGPGGRIERRETLQLAFIAALQRMPPRQVAALLLVDVLGFGTTEVAELLEVAPTTVKGLLQRARSNVAESSAQSADARRLGDHDHQLAERFATAFGRDDIDTVLELLTDDAWLAMPPASQLYQGPAAIGRFLRASADWRSGRHFRLIETAANGQPAYAIYLAGQAFVEVEPPPPDEFGPAGMIVLNLDSGRISRLTRFLDPGLPRRFGLPDRLPGPGSADQSRGGPC